MLARLATTVTVLALVGATDARAAATDDYPAATVQKWFGMAVKTHALGTNATEAAVQEVRGLNGKVLGWVFETDRVAPVVRGKRGEIGVLVGLGVDGRIKAVDVVRHREDQAWFERLRTPFYRQFEGLPADGSGRKPDTVTGATVSSRAIVNDVQSACQTVLALAVVHAAILPAAGAPR